MWSGSWSEYFCSSWKTWLESWNLHNPSRPALILARKAYWISGGKVQSIQRWLWNYPLCSQRKHKMFWKTYIIFKSFAGFIPSYIPVSCITFLCRTGTVIHFSTSDLDMRILISFQKKKELQHEDMYHFLSPIINNSLKVEENLFWISGDSQYVLAG